MGESASDWILAFVEKFYGPVLKGKEMETLSKKVDNITNEVRGLTEYVKNVMLPDGFQVLTNEIKELKASIEKASVKASRDDKLGTVKKNESGNQSCETSPCSNGRRRTKYSKLDITDITRRRLRCLMPNEWVDEEVICAVSEMLLHDARVEDENAPRRWYFPSRYGQIAMESALDFLSFVKHHRWIEKYVFDISVCEQIYIPVLDGKCRHWILLVVHVQGRKIQIWDSLPDPEFTEHRVYIARTLLKHLDILLAEGMAEGMRGTDICFEKFSIVLKMDVPRQNNGDDCGIFLITYLQTPKSA